MRIQKFKRTQMVEAGLFTYNYIIVVIPVYTVKLQLSGDHPPVIFFPSISHFSFFCMSIKTLADLFLKLHLIYSNRDAIRQIRIF